MLIVAIRSPHACLTHFLQDAVVGRASLSCMMISRLLDRKGTLLGASLKCMSGRRPCRGVNGYRNLLAMAACLRRPEICTAIRCKVRQAHWNKACLVLVTSFVSNTLVARPASSSTAAMTLPIIMYIHSHNYRHEVR
jgi:hypothetical protein